jgi:hypothetical protein
MEALPPTWMAFPRHKAPSTAARQASTLRAVVVRPDYCYMADASLWQPIITATATLAGVVAGTFGTYTIQKAQWRRERSVRWEGEGRTLFSELLSVCNQWHSSIWVRDLEEARQFEARYIELSGQISLLADETTRAAAKELGNHLHDFQASKWSNHDEEPIYDTLRDVYRSAARAQIGIDG